MSGYRQWSIVAVVFILRLTLPWHVLCQGIMFPNATPLYCMNTTYPIKEKMSNEALRILRREACTASCPRVIVSKKFYQNSLHGQFRLYCKRSILATMSQFMVMGGVLVGNLAFGYFSDKWGRKHPFIISYLGQPVFGLCVAFSPNITCFLVSKFLLNVFVGGGFLTAYTIYTEFMGEKWRQNLAITQNIPYTMGHMALGGFAYLYRNDWRWFQITISLPTMLCLFLYLFIPESARWYLSVGKTEKAIKVLEGVQRFNRKPYDHVRPLVEKYQSQRALVLTTHRKGTFKDLFRTKKLSIITLVLWINLFCNNLSYYGLAQYVGGLGGNLYWDYAISASMQIPGMIIQVFMNNFMGRKMVIISTNIMAVILLLVLIIIVNYQDYLVIPVSLAIMSTAMAGQEFYLYNFELFPTMIRNIGMGSACAFGRLGAMVGAFVADCQEYNEYIPPVGYLITYSLAAILIFILPETKHKPVADNIEDVEKLWKKKERTQPAMEEKKADVN